ncbi:glycosyltransferase [Leucobacter sp. M11]|uniref:glycosyltransferase n=1 Tax=Leucobacter sp. M11 TaxID=2993565 RepID=UPI002D7EBE98|nr:nucleotide disphospho-sugar-binding domain-containing protein [Leucobacter sp. M11]MEB4613736.1 glycosyltransferase [Leucobacter sp. M11]
MRALFLTADLGGNVPPFLAVAKELANRGIEIEMAGLQSGRVPYAQPHFLAAIAAGPEGGKGLAKSGAMMRLMAGRSTATQVSTLIAERRPDVIVVDCMFAAALRGTLGADIPVAVLFHSIGRFWFSSFDRQAGLGLGIIGLRPRKLWAAADLRLILTAPELDPASSDPKFQDYVWTGTTEKGVEAAQRETASHPRVLVALSSTDWPGMLPVYRRIVAALSELPVDALVTTGGVDLGGRLEGTPNVKVLNWADHAEILPTVDLVIGHGGHSTTLKTLAHGIPLLILPINPISDQRIIGRTVQAAGLGRTLPKSTHEPRLAETVAGMLADGNLRERASANGRKLRAADPGEKVAADHILGLLEGKGRETSGGDRA